MDRIISAVKDILVFLGYFSFFYVALCRDFRKRTMKNTVGIIAVVILWFIGIIFNYNWNSVLLLPISMMEIMSFLIIYLMFDVGFKRALAMLLGEYFLMSIFVLSIQVPMESVNMNDDSMGLLRNIILDIIIWLYYFILSRKNRNYIIQLPDKMWWIVDVIIAILALMMSFFSFAIVEMIPQNKFVTVGQFLSIVGSLIICILIFIMIYYYNRMQIISEEKEMIEKLNEQQRLYFRALLDKEEETRKFRHDIINDLLEIKNYSLKQEYNKLNDYLDNTLGEIENISKCCYDVGNEIVNTVLNYYLKPIDDCCDVEVTGYISNNIPIEERDLCTVCSNLVKNSVEAVYNNEKGTIILEFDQGNNYVSITAKNTYDGKLAIDKNGELITRKNDKRNHGIGIHNIKEVVKRYEGDYETDIDENMYSANVRLKIK